MGKVYAISDLHKGHVNMSKKRGFDSVEAHDEYIVKQWNSAISKKDTVLLLGDITMEKDDYSFLNRLNGYKKVVLGNHDQPQHVKSLLQYVNTVAGMVKYKNGIILTHAPIHRSEIKRFRINVHGHVHENSLQDNRYFNVSAEVLDFKPILITDIIDIVRKKRSTFMKRFANRLISKFVD